MRVATAQIRLYMPWVHSLKEKRMEVKSLLAKTVNRFHVSAAEVDAQDILQTAVIGFACVACTSALADSIADRVLDFMENSTQAQIVEIRREVF